MGKSDMADVGKPGGSASYGAGPARTDDIHEGYQFFVSANRDQPQFGILPPYDTVLYIMKL